MSKQSDEPIKLTKTDPPKVQRTRFPVTAGRIVLVRYRDNTDNPQPGIVTLIEGTKANVQMFGESQPQFAFVHVYDPGARPSPFENTWAEWLPRGSNEPEGFERPRVCPKCKTPNWDRPKKFERIQGEK